VNETHTVGGVAHSDAAIDPRRVARRIFIGVLAVLSFLWLLLAIKSHGPTVQEWSHSYGFDFHGGIYKAGNDILAGRSPYLAPNAKLLAAIGNAYIPPPLLAETFLPLSVLPFWLATVLLNVICAGALLGAMRLLGVRDPELLALAVCSAAFIFSLSYGDPDGVFVALAALAWRYRDSHWGGLPVGILVAAKLLLWPLGIWLLVTRRIRSALFAAGSAVALLGASWAVIGFKGLAQYPRFLAADAKVQSSNHAVAAAFRAFGASSSAATALALLLALMVGAIAVRVARGTDRGWFTAAVIAGLIASPVVFPNYFLILFVPLAICSPRSRAPWLLMAAFWLSPQPEAGIEWLVAIAIAIKAASDSQPARRALAVG
jgi:Glycosyltransferase family 87